MMSSTSGVLTAGFNMAALIMLIACFIAGVSAEDQYDVKNGRHIIIMGHRRLYPSFPVDRQLFHDTPVEYGSWFPYPKVVSHDVCYPPKGSHPARFTITAFNVTDLLPSGEGGFAFVSQGGVSSGKLCLHFKTQRGKGYKFDVTIFGYYL